MKKALLIFFIFSQPTFSELVLEITKGSDDPYSIAIINFDGSKKLANDLTVFFKKMKKNIPLYDSLFYLEEQAPLFRKTFKVDKEIKNATLLITSAGYYVAFINNNRVGKNVLDPAWTDYSKKIYYSDCACLKRYATIS